MKVRISWSTLLGYGIVFWVFLCITDLLGTPSLYSSTNKELEDICRKPDPKQPEFSASQLSWLLFVVIQNSLVVMLTMVLFTMFIITSRVAWSMFSTSRSIEACSKICSLNQYPEGVASSNNIRFLWNQSAVKNNDVQTSGTNLSKRCGSNLETADVVAKSCTVNHQYPEEEVASSNKVPLIWDQAKTVDVRKSCPNLLSRRNGNNLETIDLTPKTCRSLYRTNLSIPDNSDLGTEEQLNIECETLKEEMHRVQNFSIKEHSYLTRNLVDALKENTELTKQIAILTNENTAFKKKIRYLFQQREALTQELQIAEIQLESFLDRSQTAEAKLEQIGNDIEYLKKNLVSAFENHKVLEYNLLVSDIEVIKLNSRVTKLLILWQQPLSSELDYRTEQLLDDNNDNCVQKNMDMCCGDNNRTPSAQAQCIDASLNAVSRSETDIMNIKEKLKELEEHFEYLTSMSDDDDDKSSHNTDPEITRSNIVQSQKKLEESQTNAKSLTTIGVECAIPSLDIVEPEITISNTAIDSPITIEIQEKLSKLEKNAHNLTTISDENDNASYETFESSITVSDKATDAPNTIETQGNLKNLTTDSNNTSYATLESEITLPGKGTDSPTNLKCEEEWETQYSESSPRLICWCEKFAKVIRRKIIEPSNIQDPIRIHLAKCNKHLSNMRNRLARTEEFGSTSNLVQEPKRLVSSSRAFQNFLKNLNKFDASKKNVSINQGIYF